MPADQFTIEVTYIDNDHQFLKTLQVDKGTTIEQAILLSGVLTQCSAIDLELNKVGIFSKLKQLDDHVEQGDRVEIYRPLLADPKEARRKRAQKKQN